MSESKSTPGGAWAEVDRQKREHAGHVQPVTTCTYCQDRFVWPKATTPKSDPKDATIATLTEQRDALKDEVERLAEWLETDRPRTRRLSEAVHARALLLRLGLTEDSHA